MKPKHTPGPWKTCDLEIVSDEGEIIAEVYPTTHDSGDTSKADASLIACAPELLDALQQVFEDWTTLVGEDLKENNEAVKRIWEQCEAAINKATT